MTFSCHVWFLPPKLTSSPVHINLFSAPSWSEAIMWSQSVLSAALLLVLPSPELASPHLYPASTYPFGSLPHQALQPVYYNGFYSPWSTIQPAVQRASALTALAPTASASVKTSEGQHCKLSC